MMTLHLQRFGPLAVSLGLVLACAQCSTSSAAEAAAKWRIGQPIVSYWCGPTLTDAAVHQMAEGGWNVVWCTEKDLDLAQRHRVRGQLSDGLLTPAALDDPV